MKKPFSLFLAAATFSVGLVGYSAPSAAHHSFASEFDSHKPLVVEGTVTKARLVNPHSWLYVDVKNPDGTVTNWGFEFGTPMSLKQHGITREQVAFGAKVRLAGFRSKNGGAFGYAATVALPDGRVVRIGGAPDAPAPPLQ